MISDEVWKRFGDVRNFVEPFFGSGAVLLRRPQPFEGTETVNDIDGLVSNFWRAIQGDPDGVAKHADWPVIENDLNARHLYLVNQKNSLQDRLETDPDYFDVKIAGWWCWGACCWIGRGWCSGEGPWRAVIDEEGVSRLEKVDGDAGQGINRQIPHIGNVGQGINRQRPYLGNAGRGINRQIPHIGNAGQGINRQILHIDSVGNRIKAMMRELSERLRRVRVCCGDWFRICGPSPTIQFGLTAVFLDPPYSLEARRDGNLYRVDDLDVAHRAWEWAIKWGDHPLMRIALCGYEDEHEMPKDWECLKWKTRGGYGSQAKNGQNLNASRERVWFSPNCLKLEDEMPLFRDLEDEEESSDTP